MIIRFITEGDLISDAIRLETFSEWSHVEIFDAERNSWIGAHAVGGVQERPRYYCRPTRERWYELKVPSEDVAMNFARSKIGTAYNFEDILALFLHRDLSVGGKEICSMFVFDAFLKGGVQMLNVLTGYSNLVTPETLHLSPYLIGRSIRPMDLGGQ